ncbi:hypothetical protein Trydic_g23259 [Trypoxylus dichotomus]
MQQASKIQQAALFQSTLGALTGRSVRVRNTVQEEGIAFFYEKLGSFVGFVSGNFAVCLSDPWKIVVCLKRKLDDEFSEISPSDTSLDFCVSVRVSRQDFIKLLTEEFDDKICDGRLRFIQRWRE